MGIDHARELGAHQLGLGGVDADAGAAARGRHGRSRRSCGARPRRRPAADRNRLAPPHARAAARCARCASNSSMPRSTTSAAVLRLDRARIGLVDEDELAGLVARPDRRRQWHRSARAGRRYRRSACWWRCGEFGELVLDAAHLAQPQDRAPADHLALGFDDAGRRASSPSWRSRRRARAARRPNAPCRGRRLGLEPGRRTRARSGVHGASPAPDRR